MVHQGSKSPEIAPGDTVRFQQQSRWRFGTVTKLGRKYVHVSLGDSNIKVPNSSVQLWSKAP